MSDDEVNVALAKAMGWKWIKDVPGSDFYMLESPHNIPRLLESSRRHCGAECAVLDEPPDNAGRYTGNVPDYVNSPVASAELEDWLHQQGFSIQVDSWRLVSGDAVVGVTLDAPVATGHKICPVGNSFSAARRRALALAVVQCVGKEGAT